MVYSFHHGPMYDLGPINVCETLDPIPNSTVKPNIAYDTSS